MYILESSKSDNYFNIFMIIINFVLLIVTKFECKPCFHRGFRSSQGNVKQRERKKFIIYSIYAWGSASILTIICGIMDFVPSVPRNLIRPELGVRSCWLSSTWISTLLLHISVICIKAIRD